MSDTAGFAVIQVRSGQQPGPVTVEACADTNIDGVAMPLKEKGVVVTVASGPPRNTFIASAIRQQERGV